MAQEKTRILAVDNEPTGVELLKAILVPVGYEVIDAFSGQEALAKIALGNIDLVLLDIIMPGMDGFEVTRRIRQNEATRFIPVVLLTALNDTEDRVKGIEAGCDDFISKPFDRNEILARVKMLVAMNFYRQQVEEKEKDAHEYNESVLNTVREPLIVLDQDLKVVSGNRSFYEFFKVKPEETVGQLIYDLGNHQWDIPKLRELLEDILPQKAAFDNYEVTHDFSIIGRRIMLLNARQIQRGLGKERIILLAIEDITERKKAKDELARQIKELQSALTQIKTLRGLLPICVYCKKIRDDKEYWQQVEGYISEHSEAQFSHGVCPDCYKKHMQPELDKIKNKNAQK